MPIFGKSKSAKYDYYLLLHNLSPFPTVFNSIYVDWQRGSGKRGQTRAVGPAPGSPSKSWASYQFEEGFHVACTLNQDARGQGEGSSFEKKWLILAIMDGDKGSNFKDPLGRVVINLADYAADDDKATMSFTVAASKAISTDVGECKMLITLGCRAKGKPPMELGGKHIPREVNTAKGGGVSSDDDEDEDGPSERSSTSHPMVKPIGRKGRPSDTYDDDGFLVDEEEEPPKAAWRSVPPVPPAKQVEEGSDKDSDKDSEDEFLEQAVAAMEGNRPMPVAPSMSRQASRDGRPKATVTQVPSIGKTIPLAPEASTRSRPPDPGEQKAAAPVNVRPGGAKFALRPEGSASTSKTIEEQPQLRVAPATAQTRTNAQTEESRTPAYLTRPLKPSRKPGVDAEPDTLQPKSPRGVGGGSARQIVAPKSDAPSTSGAAKPRSVSTLVSQFETSDPGPTMMKIPSISRRTSRDMPSKASLPEPSLPRQSSKERSALSAADRPEGSPRKFRRSSNSPFAEDEPEIIQDRPERGSTPRHLASEAGSSRRAPQLQPAYDSPGEEALSQKQETDRAKGVVLPTGSVSIRKRPIVSPPIDDTPEPESPVKVSTPGRHWLDEPEDLGVDSSPSPSPPHSHTRSAYQAVALAPVARPAERTTGFQISPGGGSGRQGSFSAGSGPASPSSSSARDLGSPGTNPFLAPHAAAHAFPERESLRSLPPGPASTSSRAAPAPAAAPILQRQVPAAAPQQERLQPRQAPRPNPQPEPQLSPQPQLQTQPRPQQAAQGLNGNSYSSSGLSPVHANGGVAPSLESCTRELRAVAALEASVYLAQSGKSRGMRASSKVRNVHAPARRLARTTVSLGPEEGIIFGLRAIRAIEAAADGAGDIEGRAYWWSNCIQLRWMLWAMCHASTLDGGEADPDSNEFNWVMEVLVPPLRELEAHIFQQLFQHMWSSILVEGVTADQLPGAQAKHWIIPPSREEEAVQRWIDGFQTVHRNLLPAARSVTAGHVTLLKHKTLTALMKRLDAAMFKRLLTGEDSAGTMRRDAFSSRQSPQRWEEPDTDLPLDSRTLPFQPGGLLSFGVGVNLKMAATRWTNWAADIGLRNDKGSPEEGYLLFPKLRATADLLMMPKEVLTDRAIRSEVLPGLPLRTICELLSRFQADDLARDPLPPGLLEALQNETPPSSESPESLSLGSAGYEPPSETALLADGLIEPVVLEMDDESEEELESLVEMYDPDHQGHTTERFHLLRELWASAR